MSTVFSERCKTVTNLLPDGGIAVFTSAPPARRNRDSHYRYRNHSDILWLTGFNEEDLTLVLSANHGTHVFYHGPDDFRERWQGRVLQSSEIAARLDIPESNILLNSERDKKLISLLAGQKILYLDFLDANSQAEPVLRLLQKMPQFVRHAGIPPQTISSTGLLTDELRLIKDEFETDLMKRAAGISAGAHNHVREFCAESLKSGRSLSEFNLRAELEAKFLHGGADQIAYNSIVGSGNNATVLHYEKSDGRVLPGHLVLIDAGCELEGYASDITRTFPADGRFTPEAAILYEIVKQANEEAIRMTAPGVNLDEIHDRVLDILTTGLWPTGLLNKVPAYLIPEKTGANKAEVITSNSEAEARENLAVRAFFMHRTSHWLGLDVHDTGRYMITGRPRPLAPGMVFTIEPGLYIPESYDFIPEIWRGYGIRIEDDVLVTRTGYDVLTAEAVK